MGDLDIGSVDVSIASPVERSGKAELDDGTVVISVAAIVGNSVSNRTIGIGLRVCAP